MRKRSRPQHSNLSEITTQKFKTQEEKDSYVTILYTTDKQHSEFLSPERSDFNPDNVILDNTLSISIQLKKRIIHCTLFTIS